MSQDDELQESLPQKQGMSTTTKVVLVMLGVGGTALLLCCGGLLVSGFFLARSVKNSISTNPIQIQQVTDEILSIDIPDGFEPKQSMGMEMIGMKMATYGRSDTPQAIIMIMQNRMGFDVNDENQRQAMLDQMRMQMGLQGANASESETRDVEIDGQTVPFQFNKLDHQGGSVRQVMGFVPLKTGVIMIMVMMPEDKYDEEEVIAMLQSIREPGADAGTIENAAEQLPVPDPDAEQPTGTATPEAVTPEADATGHPDEASTRPEQPVTPAAETPAAESAPPQSTSAESTPAESPDRPESVPPPE